MHTGHQSLAQLRLLARNSILLVLLVPLAPLVLAVAVSVRLSIGSPVIFRQKRPGLDGKLFTLYKFRTMTDARESSGELLPDHQRLTSIGRFLRCSSLDELPELWNVLKGEMALVGPRPLLPQYLDRYDSHQRRRHEVLPGLTGLAQVHGRNAIDWKQRLELDVWYVDHRCFWLDLRILARTLMTVWRREGIDHGRDVTMPEFLG